MTTTPTGGYDWTTIITFPIIAGIVVGIAYTTTLTSNIYYKIGAYALAVFVVGTFIYAMAASVLAVTTVPVQPPSVAASQDPFTYDPGESPNGVIVYSGNASALGNQYVCKLKSQNTTWEDGACECNLGYYGTMCEYSGFGNDYVSLTTATIDTISFLPSYTVSKLTTWPLTSSGGCTNQCTANNNCLGVTYSGTTCTQITALSFSGAPIQTNLDPPVQDTTLYLNKLRLLSVILPGYFNVIYGILPVRYFVGNDVASGTANPIHTTQSGTRIAYYTVGVNYTIGGIPDFIAVGSKGILYISTTVIPPRSSIIPNQGNLDAIGTPILLTKTQFPFTDTTKSYYIRLDNA